MAVQLQRHLFTVKDFHRMAEARILTKDDRVELIDGEIVEITPIGSRHAACVDRLAQLAFERVSGRAIVRIQNPIQMGEALAEAQREGYESWGKVRKDLGRLA